MSLDNFRQWMRKGIEKEGSQIRYADKHGLDRAVLSLVLNGKRDPSEAFSKALGWKKEITYAKERSK